MGRIKTILTKRVSNKIFKTHAEDLKEDFDQNKPVVSSVASIKSKKLRNTIVGYVTRLKKSQEKY
ncbi:30S ribosomal protein S17e [Candidatus Woesearchaeota archaeon]|nr:30S ribosomal protein S17e [Candidatus Woesearchaeota archaeon]